MLKANAGFVRFKLSDPAPSGPVVFQVGITSPTSPLSLSAPLPSLFTAFECAKDADGALLYDTTVYISNRNGAEIRVDARITNAENGDVVFDGFEMIGPYKMLAFSLAGHLKS